MSRTTVMLVVALALVAAPVLAPAQTTSNAQVGVLLGTIPPDAKVGVLAGSLPPDATVGLRLNGAPAPATLPPGAKVGVLTGAIPPDATVGVLRNTTPAGAAVGVMSPGFAPNVGMGEPLPADRVGALESQARTHLTDHAFANTDERLRQSEALEERRLGPDSPDMARLLDSHAALLRTEGREDAASEKADRAREIRTRNEASRRGPPSLAEQLGLLP